MELPGRSVFSTFDRILGRPTRRATLGMMRALLGAFGASLSVPGRLMAAVPADHDTVPSLYSNPRIFLDAISRERVDVSRPISTTGISVPHHLLAADLIARGFWAAHGNQFERVIILSPVHFDKSQRRLATTLKDFDTVFGILPNDILGSTALLTRSSLFEQSDLFDKEHGIQALLPFVRWFFPHAKLIPIAVPATASRSDWDNAARAIQELVTQKTLLIQSTDFSHYLRREVAIQRDQETLNIIAAADRGALTGLLHPDHLDFKGCQYIQMSVQAALSSNAVVVANRNSAEYVTDAGKTTSYIVEVFTTEKETAFPISYNDQQVFYFCGDAFLGRWMNSVSDESDRIKRNNITY